MLTLWRRKVGKLLPITYKAFETKYMLWLTESILTTASEVYREGATWNKHQITNSQHNKQLYPSLTINLIHRITNNVSRTNLNMQTYSGSIPKTSCYIYYVAFKSHGKTHRIQFDHSVHLLNIGLRVHVDHDVTWGVREGTRAGVGTGRPIGKSH